ncbi:hypothetical protein AB2L27_18795 [Kineococcus sp. LSe6-4]|uniref:Plasmid pRiA4b Orf3-like domain-containing protein n=1 Tax=Kineococcus halophytocola TaxID=3234027 RepID=A0ABV4H7P4_9ACTN
MPRHPDAPEPSPLDPAALRVSLDDVEPPVWRRLDVASDLTLDDAHDALQPAMGWTNSHLHDVLWVLDRIGDEGLALTSAEYLEPVDVRAAFAALDLDAEWIGAGTREVQTLPVLEFRELLRTFGLVRRYRGRLLLTKLGMQLRGDQARLPAHLAASLPVGREEHERLPQLLALVAVAAGRSPEAREDPPPPDPALVAFARTALTTR